jgi:hypothetical protein
MSINRYQSHIFVLCEDSANRKIATGFLLNVNQRVIQILDLADGWKKAIDKFNKDYAPGMYQYPKRIMILLIDFDERENRFNYVEERIPNDLKDRVFILGVGDEPEKLKSFTCMSFEKIGETLAQDCADNTNNLWGHEELKHNARELERMREIIKPFLFI